LIYLWATALLALNTLWLLLTIVGVPGTWLMVLTTLLLEWWLPEQRMFSTGVLIAIAVLALLGEVLELVAGMFGARRGGSTGWGVVGAFLGTIVGGVLGTFVIPLPVFGSLMGACGGAAVGTVACEMWRGRPTEWAMRAGVGAGVGRLGGTIAKLGVGVVMWIVIAVAAFWP
jgi:uncharacterized protein YqgC (DUF456 family)